MLPFNFHHLYYFYTIANEGSISRASKYLRVSQPALSSQLKKFESNMELDLFHREGKSLVLSDQGRMVMAYAKTIFDAGQELYDCLRNVSKNGRIHVRIGVATFSPKACTTSLVNFFLDKEPQAHITLEENKLDVLAEKLNDHVLDIVISDVPFAARAGSSIQNKIVAHVPILFCAHKEIARKIKKLPAGLNGIPLILPPSMSPIHGAVQEYLVMHNLKPHLRAEIEDPEVIGRMLAARKGVSALNCYTLFQSPWKEELVPIGPPLEIEDTIFLITKKRKASHPLLQHTLENFTLKLPSRCRF